MAMRLRRDDAVGWKSPRGTIAGRVERSSTHPIGIEEHVAASKANPEYLVRSDRTGAGAAHRPAALRKTSS